MKNNDNNEEFKDINKKQKVFFEEPLEYIDSTEIETLMKKINQISINPTLDNSNKTEQSFILQENISNFPYYIGSFKDSLNKVFRSNKNKDLKELYESVIKEIKKVYYGYTHVEQRMYSRINQFIKFKDEENITPLQIVSKLKEISDTLKETNNFVRFYLHENFKCLKKIFKKIDERLYLKTGIKSVSLYFLLNIFDLPNNELSYILMFKIIDEVSFILKYITEILNESIKKENIKSNVNNAENIINNQSSLLEDQSGNSTLLVEGINKLKNQYIKNINELLNKLDEYNIYRAKYYNKYLYTRGNFQIDTNRYLKELNVLDDISEEYFQINTLMDEELIISKFLQRPLINEFLNFFEIQLPSSHKWNKRLIYLHSLQYNIISIITIYSFFKYYEGFLEASIFFIGKLVGKFCFNSLIKNSNRMKCLLLISNLLLIISLMILIIDNQESDYIFLNCFFKFIIGVSFCKSIETRFILNYIPKLLIKRNVKKYFRIKYLSISIGFILLTIFSYFQSLINKKIKVDVIFACFISFVILIVNYFMFKEPKLDDIVNIEMNEISEKKIKEGKEIEEEKIINDSSIEDKLNKSDSMSNISYGKAKIISVKERNKVKLMENSLKLGAGNGNYEGTNHIFSILQNLIINENLNCSSYTNISMIGHILFLALLYIIFSLIIFYNPLINSTINKDKNNDNFEKILDFKKKIWVFGIAYLLFYFSLIIKNKFKFYIIKKKLSEINYILLLFILWQILFSLLFIILHPNFFSASLVSFDNYLYITLNSVLLLFFLIIEKIVYKIMIREIPLEANFFGINIDNFLDIYESFVKAAIFAIFFAINFFNINFNHEFIYLIVIVVLLLFELLVFIIFNYRRKQYSLIKIINKVTYESF